MSDAAIRKAVAEHNEVCRIITEIGDMRKLGNPPIMGYEFHVLCLVSYCCPKALILDKLRETLRRSKPAFRTRSLRIAQRRSCRKRDRRS
ncbi:MAG: 2-hydroxyacyl-CoA dehydratase family protein [Oscillospiraceae bacterium]